MSGEAEKVPLWRKLYPILDGDLRIRFELSDWRKSLERDTKKASETVDPAEHKRLAAEIEHHKGQVEYLERYEDELELKDDEPPTFDEASEALESCLSAVEEAIRTHLKDGSPWADPEGRLSWKDANERWTFVPLAWWSEQIWNQLVKERRNIVRAKPGPLQEIVFTAGNWMSARATWHEVACDLLLQICDPDNVYEEMVLNVPPSKTLLSQIAGLRSRLEQERLLVSEDDSGETITDTFTDTIRLTGLRVFESPATKMSGRYAFDPELVEAALKRGTITETHVSRWRFLQMNPLIHGAKDITAAIRARTDDNCDEGTFHNSMSKLRAAVKAEERRRRRDAGR